MSHCNNHVFGTDKSFGRVRQVNVLEGKLVLSERAAMMEAVTAALNPGDVVEGIVTRLADYGAFVSLRSPDGNLHGIEARLQFETTHRGHALLESEQWADKGLASEVCIWRCVTHELRANPWKEVRAVRMSGCL